MRKRLLWTLVLTVVLSLVLSLAPASAFAQEAGGFTATFDDSSLEGWEYAQDVLVENGVLRLDPGGAAFRVGSWSLFSLRVRARFTAADGVGLIHYHATDQASYDLRIASDQWTLTRTENGAPTQLASGSAGSLDLTEWTDIEVTLVDREHRVTAAGQEILTASETEVLPPGALGFVPAGSAPWELDTVEFEPQAGAAAPVDGGAGVAPVEGDQGAVPAEGEAGAVPAEGGQTTATTTAGTQTSDGGVGGFFSGQASRTELGTFAINLALAALCALVLGIVYVYWGSSLTNRRKFAANFIFITVTTTFIILVVRSSIALSLGLVGALSITRFRHAIKEPEELAYLFVAIGIGIGLGDDQRLITLLTLAVIIVLAALMRFVRHSQADVNLHLNIAVPADRQVDVGEVVRLLKQHCSKAKLLRFDENSETTELSFVVEFRQTSDLGSVRTALKHIFPVVDISFLDNRGIW